MMEHKDFQKYQLLLVPSALPLQVVKLLSLHSLIHVKPILIILRREPVPILHNLEFFEPPVQQLHDQLFLNL